MRIAVGSGLKGMPCNLKRAGALQCRCIGHCLQGPELLERAQEHVIPNMESLDSEAHPPMLPGTVRPVLAMQEESLGASSVMTL